jgi:hypothetical protein
VGEDGWGSGDASADAGLEIPPDPRCNGLGAAVGLEAFEIEAQVLDPLPEVRIIDAAAVGVERVDYLEESALQSRRLSRRVQGGRARMLAGDREVTEDDRRFACADLSPGGSAAGAAEVGVDDQL